MLRLAAFVVALGCANPAAAGPDAGTFAFWERCVAATEARINAANESAFGDRPSVVAARLTSGHLTPEGPNTAAAVERVPDTGSSCVTPAAVAATIQNWRGSILVPHMTVDEMLHSLANVLPQQEDVVAAKFLARNPGPSAPQVSGSAHDAATVLRPAEIVTVYLRIVRRKIITVVFDTEHEMRFNRHSPTVAFSRSVMTKVVEVDNAGTPQERLRLPDEDRGLLWKLNSYSTYTQQGDGVLVTMESLTLSRDVPFLLRPIAGPIIDSIARESMVRTLEGLWHRSLDPHRD